MTASESDGGVSRALQRFLSLNDFEVAARRILPAPLFGFVSGGVEDNHALALNRRAFSRYVLVPEVLADVSSVDASLDLFGQRFSAPVGIAPMGASGLTSYRGDMAYAVAARKAGIPFILSGASVVPLEEVIAVAPDTWFQAYLPGEQGQIDALVDRVAAAGVHTLVLTVDTAVAGNRENNLRAGFSLPLRPGLAWAWRGLRHPRWLWGTVAKTVIRHGLPHYENSHAARGPAVISRQGHRAFSNRAHLSWEHAAAVRKRWKGALVLKGVLHPRDVGRARALGIDGVIASNHGGRQLDGSIAPLLALPQLVEAAGPMAVMLDSGVRRGGDVLKALALGAKAAWIGRPFNYAAVVGGEAGVRRAAQLIGDEIRRDMALLGVRQLDELDASRIRDIGG